MERVSWTPERVHEIQKTMKDEGLTLQQAADKYKFSQAAYYRCRKDNGMMKKDNRFKENKVTRVYNRRGPKLQAAPKPMTLEMAAPGNNNRIVIMITDRSQVKNILNEVF